MHLFLYYDAGDFIRIHLGIIGVAGVEKTNIAFVWLLMLTHGYQDTRRYRCLVSIHNFHNFRMSSKIPRNPAAMQGKSLAANKSKPCLNLIRYCYLRSFLGLIPTDRTPKFPNGTLGVPLRKGQPYSDRQIVVATSG